MVKGKLEISEELKLHLKKMQEVLAGVSIDDFDISEPKGCDALCGAYCRHTCAHYCYGNCDFTCLGQCDDFFAIGCTMKMIF